jgi:hypothetical protein
LRLDVWVDARVEVAFAVRLPLRARREFEGMILLKKKLNTMLLSNERHLDEYRVCLY